VKALPQPDVDQMEATEVPLFLPSDAGHLAAILGIPAGPSRILVVLLTGGSRHGRGHRNRMWVKVARGLRADEVFTLRLDLPGVGDSEGRPRQFSMEDPLSVPISQAVGTVVRDTGVDRVLLVGSCFGARACLAAAPLIPEATDILFIAAPPLVRKIPLRSRTYKAGYSRVTARLPRTKRILPLPRRWDFETLQRLERPVSRAFSKPLLAFTRERRGTVLFLFGENDVFLYEMRTALDRLASRLPPGSTDLRIVPGAELHAFSEIRAQDETIRITMEWVRARLHPLLGSTSASRG
jgi:pimeloyl-ACP methyl ester carboxylesterase